MYFYKRCMESIMSVSSIARTEPLEVYQVAENPFNFGDMTERQH